MPHTTQYGDFTIKAYRQSACEPFKPFVAIATHKVSEDRTEGFSVSGNTLEEAVEKAKVKIDEAVAVG